MAKKVTKKINSQFNPSFVGGYPVYAFGGYPEMYGFGSWLKQNAGSVGTVAGLGLGALVGMPGLGAQVGGQLGGAVQGGYEQQQNNLQAAVDNRKQELMSNLPAQSSYVPTFADGGPIKNNNQNYSKAWGDFYNAQSVYTKALANKYPKIPIKDILNNSVQDTTFNNSNLENYSKELIGKYGDFHLTPSEMDSVSQVNNLDIRSIQDTLSKYDKGTVSKNAEIIGGKETSPERFGPRMMLHRRYDKGNIPYKFLNEYKKGGELKQFLPELYSPMDNFQYQKPMINPLLEGVRFTPQDIAHIGIKKDIRQIPKNSKYDWDLRSDISKDMYQQAHDNDKFVNNYFNWDKKANGGEITDRLVEFKNGGSHESSPLGGIPIGNNALTEEGEFMYTNKQGKKYIFTNRF